MNNAVSELIRIQEVAYELLHSSLNTFHFEIRSVSERALQANNGEVMFLLF